MCLLYPSFHCSYREITTILCIKCPLKQSFILPCGQDYTAYPVLTFLVRLSCWISLSCPPPQILWLLSTLIHREPAGKTQRSEHGWCPFIWLWSFTLNDHARRASQLHRECFTHEAFYQFYYKISCWFRATLWRYLPDLADCHILELLYNSFVGFGCWEK